MKNVTIRPGKKIGSRKHSESALSLAAVQMAKLNLGNLNVINEGTGTHHNFKRIYKSEMVKSVLDKKQQGDPYKHVKSMVRSIRQKDDSLVRKSKHFDVEYRKAFEQETEDGDVNLKRFPVTNAIK